MLVTSILLMSVLALVGPPQSSSCLSRFHGTWRGPGTVLGRPVVMEQQWGIALGGAFHELRMRHLATDTSTAAQFEGRGFYRTLRDRPDSVSGAWFDARGIQLTIAGACTESTFASSWTGAERGRTVYQLEGDELVVIDSVFPATGAAREFGRSRLRRR